VHLVHPPIAPWLVRTAAGCRVRLACRGAPTAVHVRVEPDNEARLIEMQPDGTCNGMACYAAALPWDPSGPTTHYAFRAVAGGRAWWLAADGAHGVVPRREVQFKVCRDDRPPAWVADQVFYQIFPDRFCQGDPALAVATDEYVFRDGRHRVVRERWGAPVDPARAATAFYGGDLVGVRAQLAYLHDELGVTALYLNPIFTASSNHKYDTADYDHVDPHLGGDAALAALAAELHARGMRLILDAVVNHTGADHPWFDRYGRHATLGAYQSPASPWRGWYVFDAAGGYASWNGHGSLPVLDYANPEVCARIYAAPDAVLRRWLRPPYAIDGWRFDVIHMLGEGAGARNNAHHVRALRRAVREENPEAYVLGEHFAEATRWLQGDQEDGAMNYDGFGLPVRAWLAADAPLPTAELAAWLTAARARIPYDNQLAQLSLLDSHDTSRMLTVVGGDVARMRLAVTLLFTYPGAPCIYYGDEIGLAGGDDPDCRRCFDWDRARWDAGLHAHYRAMIALRARRPELRRGAHATLAVTDEALAFARYTDAAITVVAVNRGAAPAALALPLADLPVAATTWRDGAGPPAAPPATLTVPAGGWAILCGDA
jgi:alpha-glucosidase